MSADHASPFSKAVRAGRRWSLTELRQDRLTDGRQGWLRRRARASFFPTRCPEAAGLQEGEGDHAHESVSMKSLPSSSLEVIKAELFLELLVSLLADPAGLDWTCNGFVPVT